MTVVVEDTATTAAVTERSAADPASWHSRAGAFTIDVVPGIVAMVSTALAALMLPSHSAWWWASVSTAAVVLLVIAVDRLLLPTVIGCSLGRAIFGIAVMRPDGANCGPWRLLLRDVAHLLDTASALVGWLWPLWDSRRRTFADLLLRTEVRGVEPGRRPRNVRRLAAAVMLAAAMVCIGGAAMDYAVVYRYERAVDRARAQIATTGPKIVEQILTYDPKSLPDDFARAQSLTTESYREQLVAQQQTVQQGHPVINEYWVTNSSVQSATPDRATMLLFMQGQRGASPEERYISATVRVSFAKSASARWLVDDLTVVTKPNPVQGGK